MEATSDVLKIKINGSIYEGSLETKVKNANLNLSISHTPTLLTPTLPKKARDNKNSKLAKIYEEHPDIQTVLKLRNNPGRP